MAQQQEIVASHNAQLLAASAPSKFRQLAVVKKATDNDLGIGYIEDPSAGSRVVIANLNRTAFVTLATRNSFKQYEQTIEEFIAIPEFRFILFEVARAYRSKEACMLEGGTAIGKSYAVASMGKLLYGPNTVLPEVFCSGQTDVSELMGKPVPASLSNAQLKATDEFLASPDGDAMRLEMLHQEGRIDTLELMLRVSMRLGFPVQRGSFRLQPGKLLTAMNGDIAPDGSFIELPNGPGVPFHIQELGTAPPLVTNALLRTRGTKGRIAEIVQMNELDGSVVTAGPAFGLIMSTNPVGQDFRDRFVIDSANARAVVWIRLPDILEIESLRKAAARIFSFDRIERDAEAPQAILDLSKYQQLGEMLGIVTSLFHEQYSQTLAHGEASRRQKIPVTMDHMWKVARYLQHYQQESSSGDTVDLVATLRNAVICHYINALESKPSVIGTGVQASTQTKGLQLLNHLDQTLTNIAASSVQYRGEEVTYCEAIESLTKEAWNAEVSKERTEGLIIAQDLVRPKLEAMKVQALLNKLRISLPEEDLRSYVESLRANANEEAQGVIDSWIINQGWT
jgi:hypothetical protein